MVALVIAICGMPGAGKSIVAEVARELGYRVYSMGDIVRDEAGRLGIDPTPANLGMLTLELRRKEGQAVVARRLIDKLGELDAQTVVVEGVRSPEEVEELRKRFTVTIIAVMSSPETRYSRLKARGRSDDPKDVDEFRQRDQREFDLGIAKVIKSAQKRVTNETDANTFRRQVRHVLEEM